MTDSEEDINFESADEDEKPKIENKLFTNEIISENKINETDNKIQDDSLHSKSNENNWNWNTLIQFGSNVINQGTNALNHAGSTMSTFTSHVSGNLVHTFDSVQSGFIRHQDSSENFEDDSQWKPTDNIKEPIITNRVDEDSTKECVGEIKECKEESTKECVVSTNECKEEGDGWLSSLGLTGFMTVINSANSVVHQTTQSVGNSGIKMMNTGLDVLESIGKKTYDVVIEGDLGLKQVLQKNMHSKPNLSQILREARIQTDLKDKENEDIQNISYSYWFDNLNGIAYLEALETLSSVSQQQVESYLDKIPKNVIDSIKIEHGRIKKAFEDSVFIVDDEQIKHNFNEDLDKYSFDSTIPVTISKLLESHDEFLSWMYKYENKESVLTSQDIYIEAIKQLALFTALSIEHLHRISMVLLREQTPIKNEFDIEFIKIGTKEYNYVEVAKAMTRLVVILNHEITNRATQFTNCISIIDLINSKEIITNIYLESVNCCSYIHKSLQLCLPILQLASIKQNKH